MVSWEHLLGRPVVPGLEDQINCRYATERLFLMVLLAIRARKRISTYRGKIPHSTTRKKLLSSWPAYGTITRHRMLDWMDLRTCIQRALPDS